MGWGDFNAMVEGYERKKREHYEFERDKTFMLTSAWVKETYHQFKNRWKFDWERQMNLLTKEQMPTADELEKIKANHARIAQIAKARKK